MEKKFPGTGPARFPAGVLIGLAVLILIRQLILMFNAVSAQSIVGLQELSLWIDDFAIASPLMILSGLLLWKKKIIGYVSAPGLLLAYASLSFGLLPFLYIQSQMKKEPFDWEAVIILLIMAVLCLIPFFRLIPKKSSANS